MVGTSVGTGSPKLVTCLQSLPIPGYFGGGKEGVFYTLQRWKLEIIAFLGYYFRMNGYCDCKMRVFLGRKYMFR
jgi:hypothetical protein